MFNFFALFSIALANQPNYEPLNNSKFDSCHSAFVKVRGANNSYPLWYSYCNREGISQDFVESRIRKYSSYVLDFANILSLDLEECRDNKNLEIYEISFRELNDKALFDGWQSQNVGANYIWALFDPRSSEPKVSSIMLTNQGPEYNDIILAHELSHYWYERLCFNRKWTHGSESFAVNFERYFEMLENK